MKKFRYTLQVVAEVEAFDEDDADEAIDDTFGVGSDGNLNIAQLTIVNCEPLE